MDDFQDMGDTIVPQISGLYEINGDVLMAGITLLCARYPELPNKSKCVLHEASSIFCRTDRGLLLPPPPSVVLVRVPIA